MQTVDSNKQQLETHQVIKMAIVEQEGEKNLQENSFKYQCL